jgi:hypothetical protein
MSGEIKAVGAPSAVGDRSGGVGFEKGPEERYSYVDPATRLSVGLRNPRPNKEYRGFVDAERADNGRKVTIESSRVVIR